MTCGYVKLFRRNNVTYEFVLVTFELFGVVNASLFSDSLLWSYDVIPVGEPTADWPLWVGEDGNPSERRKIIDETCISYRYHIRRNVY